MHLSAQRAPEVDPATLCVNCGGTLVAEFCAGCGQRPPPPPPPLPPPPVPPVPPMPPCGSQNEATSVVQVWQFVPVFPPQWQLMPPKS